MEQRPVISVSLLRTINTDGVLDNSLRCVQHLNTVEENRGLPKIERAESLEEQSYLLIKQAILDCTFQPGEFLAEVRLAEELGTSKTPIRKAMARLESNGLVVNIPFKGYSVADITVEDIVEIYELREILEPYLVRKTASQLTADELEKMEAIIQAAEAALKQGDFSGYTARNREFHHYFAQKYGNQRILNVLTHLDDHVQRILAYLSQKGFDHLQGPDPDHQLIVTAIQEGKFDSAASLMKRHLASFRDTLVSGGYDL